MARLWRTIAEEPVGYTAFLSLSAIIIILTAFLRDANSADFQRYFGRINPLFAVFTVFAAGLVLLTFLLRAGQFAIFRSADLKGILLAMGLALPFAAVMVFVDSRAPYPPDINVAWPNALAFYPVMGYVVEVLFHVLPVGLLYFIFQAITGDTDPGHGIWAIILIAALLEPAFQVVAALGQIPAWSLAFLGVHLFLFNAVQLFLFRQYDFVSMYAFRLSYYALWHVAWGHFRLGLLF